ncbi:MULTISPECIES: glycosyltransferase family 1 protein [unclassified Synechocystis]|uniref:glycosyltransferase family 4 protein n=1 Tax=unclassified Synechocystis TaxID=2640012 RepID=UPI0003FC67C8|nr:MULTISPECIES: glycosyltransferase family 1 protein [unclassified Synechocystis]AIE73420.1 Glycosyl transferase, group 1 [Synechocystis sp. PCC 6714]MCT0254220.1 glycosyltransferase family 4 protein [Synechocystis sp. CS-94]
MTGSHLLVNLSFLLAQPTGLSVYAGNVFPHLKPLKPTLLTSQLVADFPCQTVPNNLTPAQGSRGHFNRLVWTQFQLTKLYRQLKGSLLFSPIPEAPLWADCRTVVMVHDLIPLRFPNWKSPLTSYCKFYLPLVLGQAEHILCNSQATADDVIDYFGISANKITPIALGYDRQHFQLGQDDLAQRRNPYFLFVGRHDPHKNVGRIIRAFAQFVQNINVRDIDLILAGPTDRRYTPKLMALAAELGVETQVHCLDYVSYDQLRQLYRQAIALVFPSLWEGFGFPVLESMACGTVVITSSISSLPEVGGDAVLLVDPYSIQEIYQGMEHVWKDENLRQHLQQKSLAKAKEFSWEKTGNLTMEVLAKYL